MQRRNPTNNSTSSRVQSRASSSGVPPVRQRRRIGAKPITHRENSGYKYTPSAQIPESNPKPWWPLTISITSSPKEIKAEDIRKAFRAQLQPGTPKSYLFADINLLHFDARYLRVEAWNLTGKALSLTIYQLPPITYNPAGNFSPVTTTQLGGWTDAGGTNSFPRLGYVYPLASQAVSYPVQKFDDPSYSILTTTAGASTDTILHRIHILFRPHGDTIYTSVLNPSLDSYYLADTSRSLSNQIEASLRSRHKALLSILKSILNKIPSNLEESDSDSLSALVSSFEHIDI